MIPAIRSEFRKFFTTRLWWGMAIAHLRRRRRLRRPVRPSSLNQGRPTGGPGGSADLGDDTQIANTVYTSGISVGYLLLLTIGVHVDRLRVPAQDDHAPPSCATPKRTRAMLAKVVALIGIGAVYGLISLIGSVAVGAVGPDPDRPPALPLLDGRPHRWRSACSCWGCGP